MSPLRMRLGNEIACLECRDDTQGARLRRAVFLAVVSPAAFFLVLGSASEVVAADRDSGADTTFPVSIAVACVEGRPVRDDPWIADQLETARTVYAKANIGFRWTLRREISREYAAMRTRSDRDSLSSLVERNVIDVFVVGSLEDVDEPGRYRKGVAWTHKMSRKRFIILSAAAPPTVLAHELGHFFGNGHSEVPDNLMSYTRTGGPVFLDDAQIERVRTFSAGFLSSGRLFDVGPPRRMP